MGKREPVTVRCEFCPATAVAYREPDGWPNGWMCAFDQYVRCPACVSAALDGALTRILCE
jgi:hypothetical protein